MAPVQLSTEAALDVLRPLKTGAAVAGFLHAQGILGRRGSHVSCPVSIFLNEKTGVAHSTGAWTTRPVANYPLDNTKLPLPVVAFISAFDQGEYPELIDARYEP
jgi:hypothetical protein